MFKNCPHSILEANPLESCEGRGRFLKQSSFQHPAETDCPAVPLLIAEKLSLLRGRNQGEVDNGYFFFLLLPVDCENIKDKGIPHLNFKSLAISVLAKT